MNRGKSIATLLVAVLLIFGSLFYKLHMTVMVQEHEYELSKVEIALQQAESRAEFNRVEADRLREENFILRDQLSKIEAKNESERYLEGE